MPVAGEASAGRLLIPSELWSMQIGMPAARPDQASRAKRGARAQIAQSASGSTCRGLPVRVRRS